MLNKIILASQSKVRKSILDAYEIFSEVKPSNVDEDVIKESLIKENFWALRIGLSLNDLWFIKRKYN